jgi:hypothetical protein
MSMRIARPAMIYALRDLPGGAADMWLNRGDGEGVWKGTFTGNT